MHPKERAMRWEFALLVGLTACPGPNQGDDDVDANMNGSRVLHLAWSVKPSTIPDTTSSNVRITGAYFGAQNLRVVGDAIGPGDLRTYVDRLPIEWATDKVPKVSNFLDAPSGLYSRVGLELDDEGGGNSRDAYEITGTVNIEGSFVPFVIRDAQGRLMSVTIDPQVSLALHDDKTVRVQIDLTKITGTVDFDDLPVRDGKRVLDENNSQIGEVRKKLGEAFSVDNSPQ